MKCGLIGRKLGHSYSKEIHEMLGLYDYELIELEPEDLADFVSRTDFSPEGFAGFNVTIPYKKKIMELCPDADPSAEKIGAANTVYVKDGKLCCANTDRDGFLYMAAGAGISFEGKKALVLGNGGASLMVQRVLSEEGASSVSVATRHKDLSFPSGSRSGKIEVGYVSYDALPEDAEIVINTTPVGMYPGSFDKLIDLDCFPRCTGVLDLIYNPLRTPLILDALERDISCSGGLPMLVAQAIAAAAFFSGRDLGERTGRVLETMEKNIENIVLTGMPGSGKTSVGKALAGIMDRSFVDLDEETVKLAGMSIPDIFRRYGEERFRDMESITLKKYSAEKGLVIATGGGSVLRKENLRALRANGRIVLLERPLHELPTDGRPLSVDMDALKKMEARRRPIYENACDMKIVNDSSVRSAAREIMSKL